MQVLAAVRGVGGTLSGVRTAPSGLLLDPGLVPPRLISMLPLYEVTAGVRYSIFSLVRCPRPYLFFYTSRLHLGSLYVYKVFLEYL